MGKNRRNNAKHSSLKGQNIKDSKKIFFILIQLILIGVFIFSGYQIYIWHIDNEKNSDLIEDIKESKTVDDSNESLVDFNMLKNKNPDTIAWINVEGTDIDYPVVQTINNDYYLNHSFDKSVNGAGWIFLDYKNKLDGTDKNIVVFGHNRRDGSMFSSLKNILKAEWYNDESNRIITFITEQENINYEVFSVYQIENEDYYIKTDFTGNSFSNYLQTIKKRSIKNFGIDVDENDSILTLSTCANDSKYRVVLHAKKLYKQ